MAQQTFEEWWKRQNAYYWGSPHNAASAAWHARDPDPWKEEVKALQTKLLELEGIDKACDTSQQHVLLLQKDVERLQARIELARGLVNKMLEPCSCIGSCLICSTRKDAYPLLAALEEKESPEICGFPTGPACKPCPGPKGHTCLHSVFYAASSEKERSK
jgi:hypothetical protein